MSRLKMKKILFLITNLAHGGAERVLVNLANNLDKTKYKVTVMTIFDSGINKKYLSEHIRYLYFFPKTFHGIKYITKILPARLLHRIFIKEKYDVEIAYLEGPPAKIISGCPSLETKKLAWIHIELNTNRAFTEGFANKDDAVHAYKKFDKIVCVAETVRQQFIAISGIQNNVVVKYNTNETDKIKTLSKEECQDILYGDEIPTICSVAKIEYTKGYDRLIAAHKQLLDEGFVHRIYIIGMGGELDALKQKVKQLGLENTFFFIGFQENPYKYISKCDLYVCSSRREGFSTAVTESLILGTPVVSTECSGAKELLGDNDEYGLVVENSTKGIYWGLKRMLQEPGLLEHYKKQAQIRGMYFSREKTVTAVENMLENIE